MFLHLLLEHNTTHTGQKEPWLVSWYFAPSQPQRITSGLKTIFNLSPIFLPSTQVIKPPIIQKQQNQPWYKCTENIHKHQKNVFEVSQLVSWCFQPSQPQRITSGVNTDFTLSRSYPFHKSSFHKSCVVFFYPIYIPQALNTGTCLRQGDLFYPVGLHRNHVLATANTGKIR